MSVSGKTVYRVRQLVGHDVAIISEVKDGDANSGKVKETRDSRMALWGTDSFWLVTGEKKEPKILLQKEDAISPAFSLGVSPMAAKIQASSIFKVPKLVNENVVPGKFDIVSFSSATKLIVGYSPQDGSNDETLVALSQGTLHIPLETTVSAIEVRPGQWLTSGFDALPSGRYSLKRAPLRSVATVALENSPEMIRLGYGLVVFASNPKWSEPKCTDLRAEEEIFQSVERWLSRATAAVTLPAGSMAPAELLRLLADRAVSDEEKADLAAVAGHLSMRTELADILPEILGRDAGYKDMIARFGEAEKIRLRAELEDQLRRETEADRARLAALREEVATAEAKLATFSHREALLRTETEKHEETLRDRIASAAEGIKSDSSRETAMIREEVARLRDDMAQIAAAPAPTAPMPVVAPQPEEAAPPPPLPPFASDEQRQKTVRELSVATGLTQSEVAAVIALGVDVVPVLVGTEAAAAVVDIATAIAGVDAAIVFCDPTKLSLADLLNDENSGFKVAIDVARARPEMLAAAALCGITNGPCEYWLPQIIEMRRVGRLPRNLALFASAGSDGMRISIPDTALRHLFPVAAGKLARPGAAKFEGLWPSAGSDPERFQEAVDILIDGGLEGVVMQNAARALVRTPAWMKVGDLKDVFLRHAKWLSATAAGDEHEHNKYFKNIEG